jgi:hypothetical protein
MTHVLKYKIFTRDITYTVRDITYTVRDITYTVRDITYTVRDITYTVSVTEQVNLNDGFVVSTLWEFAWFRVSAAK